MLMVGGGAWETLASSTRKDVWYNRKYQNFSSEKEVKQEGS